MNEAQTRAEHIEPALRASGWGVTPGSKILREYRITEGRKEGANRRSPAEIADFVLYFRNQKLAIVEAKAWARPLTEGVAQAKQYAAKLAVRFAFSTNGQGVWSIDCQSGAEGQIESYPTPEELWTRTYAQQNEWRDRFAQVPYEDKGGTHGARYYQDIAIDRVLEAIAAGRRRVLLTLATGTGKTFIAFQLAWKLFHARWNASNQPTRRPRILFLADRNILASQAYNAFSAFPDDALIRIKPEEITKKGRVPKNGSIFFTIFQTFMSGPPKPGESEPSPYFGDYPPDFFDFIIIDECHRGGAKDESSWRGILEYFAPAVQLGLTATPKRKDNADTYKYFGDPVFIYSLKEGINDGFLTPFRVRQIATTLDKTSTPPTTPSSTAKSLPASSIPKRTSTASSKSRSAKSTASNSSSVKSTRPKKPSSSAPPRTTPSPSATLSINTNPPPTPTTVPASPPTMAPSATSTSATSRTTKSPSPPSSPPPKNSPPASTPATSATSSSSAPSIP